MSKAILCAPSLPTEIKAELSALTGLPCVPIPPCEALPEPTRCHPDMLFFNLPKTSETVTSLKYYAANHGFFQAFQCPKLIFDDAPLSHEYPDDILFDALSMGDALYCKASHTSKELKSRFRQIIPLRQGYAACSTLKLSDRAAITADPNIVAALTENGIRVLKISAGNIALPGYSCGFIGGASAVICNKVIFFGSLREHPSYTDISEFCRAEGVTVTDFPSLELTDHGSIRTLSYL